MRTTEAGLKRALLTVVLVSVNLGACTRGFVWPHKDTGWQTERIAKAEPLTACSEAKNSERPWVGRWAVSVRRWHSNHPLVLEFDIEEAVVRGAIESGGKDFSVVGEVDEQGAINATIYGIGSSDRMNVRGTFPNLKLTSHWKPHSPVIAILDGQLVRLCR